MKITNVAPLLHPPNWPSARDLVALLGYRTCDTNASACVADHPQHGCPVKIIPCPIIRVDEHTLYVSTERQSVTIETSKRRPRHEPYSIARPYWSRWRYVETWHRTFDGWSVTGRGWRE